MQIVQFILFGIFGLFAVFFLASGAIGYLLYSSSNSPEIPPLVIPNWRDLPKVPRQVLIAGAIALSAVWVLIGNTPSKQKDEKIEQGKGRRRRYLDED